MPTTADTRKRRPRSALSIKRAALNRDKAKRLKKKWKVNAKQVRYRDNGQFYMALKLFPAALFDANGYIRFATEEDYRNAPMKIFPDSNRIVVNEPGISGMPGYTRMSSVALADSFEAADHFAKSSDIEGTMTEIRILKRKRSRALRDAAFKRANNICCVCDRNFSKLLGGRGVRVLQVHHRRQLAALDEPKVNTIDDLAVVCANCHLLLHLDPKKAMAVDELKRQLAADSQASVK